MPIISAWNKDLLWSRTICAIVGSGNNINKLPLVGMQLPESDKGRISTFRAKALRLDLIRRAFAWNVEILLIFSGSCIPTNESLFLWSSYSVFSIPPTLTLWYSSYLAPPSAITTVYKVRVYKAYKIRPHKLINSLILITARLYFKSLVKIFYISFI
jgi:hypothetical protein